jgi:uncharacterized protein YcbX
MSENYRHASTVISKYLGIECSLVKCVPNQKGFANESEYLLVNRDSFQQLEKWTLGRNESIVLDIACFRANIIVASVGESITAAFNEDFWLDMQIGEAMFQVSSHYWTLLMFSV